MPSPTTTIPVLTLKRKQMLNTLISVAMLTDTQSFAVSHWHTLAHTGVRSLFHSLFAFVFVCVSYSVLMILRLSWSVRCVCVGYDAIYCKCVTVFVCIRAIIRFIHTHAHTKLPDHLSVNWEQWAENFKLNVYDFHKRFVFANVMYTSVQSNGYTLRFPGLLLIVLSFECNCERISIRLVHWGCCR